MKAKHIIIVLAILLLGSCVKKEPSFAPSPFKPVLERIITELMDSLKDEIGENKLLSIEFYNPEFTYYDRRGNEMRMYILDGFASDDIVGYAKIGSTTIAIYNLKDDFYELVNKNGITFFTDTVLGFKDICTLDLTGKKQFFYKIVSEDSITKVSYSRSFPYSKALRLMTKCRGDISFTPPEEMWFHDDSLRAEENFKYYQEVVKYYRNK